MSENACRAEKILAMILPEESKRLLGLPNVGVGADEDFVAVVVVAVDADGGVGDGGSAAWCHDELINLADGNRFQPGDESVVGQRRLREGDSQRFSGPHFDDLFYGFFIEAPFK